MLRIRVIAGFLVCLFLLTGSSQAADVSSLIKAVGDNDLNAVRRILAEDAELAAARSREGITPFHLSVTKGYIGIVKMFIFANADVNVQDSSGATPIMRAAETGHFEMVRLLNESMADLRIRDEKGWTVLHYAATYGKPEIIEYLMLRGAEINVRTNEGTTPMTLAKWKNRPEAANLIESYGGVD